MPKLKVSKRAPSAINNDIDFNPSVFRYFVEGQEIKHQAVKDGVKSAFLGMLDTIVIRDESLYDELSDWKFEDIALSTIGSGGGEQTTNTYTGILYIYRPIIITTVSPAIPATLGTYTGSTYAYRMTNMMTMAYVLEPDLSKATHGVENGVYQTLNYWNGTAPISAVTQITQQGYYPITGNEVGTHGKNNDAYEPLSYWDSTVTSTPGNSTEYTGILKEVKTGFTLDSKRIGLTLTPEGEALLRYNPVDLTTFTSLIKLHYSNRIDSVNEVQI